MIRRRASMVRDVSIYNEDIVQVWCGCLAGSTGMVTALCRCDLGAVLVCHGEVRSVVVTYLLDLARERVTPASKRRTNPPTRPRNTPTRGDTGGVDTSTIRFSATCPNSESL